MRTFAATSVFFFYASGLLLGMAMMMAACAKHRIMPLYPVVIMAIASFVSMVFAWAEYLR